MKKLIILAFLVLAASTYAQNIILKSDNSASKTGPVSFTGTTAYSYDFDINRPYLYYYDVQVTLDSVFVSGDNPHYTVALSGSIDDSKYYSIASVEHGLGSSDSTIRFTNLSAAQIVTNASHTETTATATDYIRGSFIGGNRTDYISGTIDSVNADLSLKDDTLTIASSTYLGDDTLTVAQRVNTVAAQTLTTAEGAVRWRYLRITMTGAGATAKASLDRICCANLPGAASA